MKRSRKILACLLVCVVCMTMFSGCKSILDSFDFVLDFEKINEFFGGGDSVSGLSWPQKGVFAEIPQFSKGVITHSLDDGEEGILCISSVTPRKAKILDTSLSIITCILSVCNSI